MSSLHRILPKWWGKNVYDKIEDFEYNCESSDFLIGEFFGRKVRVVRLYKGRKYVHSGNRMRAVRCYFSDRGVKKV